MNCIYRLLHKFKYRYVNRCYVDFINVMKLFVSRYNQFETFRKFLIVCLLTVVETTRKKLYKLIIF